MEAVNTRVREIRFFSTKNNRILIVHTESAKKYADSLENNADVISYEVCKKLDADNYLHIPKVGIKATIFQKEWTTDFLIKMKSGEMTARELCYKQDFLKTMNIQKMEFSRRYWEAQGINDWKIILI